MFTIFVILIILFVLIMVGLITGASVSAGNTIAKRKIIQEHLKSECGAATLYVSFVDCSCLGISWDKRKIYLGNGAQPTEYDFSQILAADLDIDRVTVASSEGSSSTKRGSQLVGAAVGGLAFGPAGAVVGGLTGSRRNRERTVTEEETRSITLKVKVVDQSNPIYFIQFWNSDEYEAETFYSHILNVLNGQHGDKQQNREQQNDVPVISTTDELERLWKLKEAGALTAEEFESEKALIRNHQSRSFLRSADVSNSKPLDKTELGETQ